METLEHSESILKTRAVRPPRMPVHQLSRSGLYRRARKGDPFAVAALAQRRLDREAVLTDVNWDDEEDAAFHKKLARRQGRITLLDALVGQFRRCPCCGDTRPNSRQWCVLKRYALGHSAEARRVQELTPMNEVTRARVAVCRSCAFSTFREALG